MRSPLSLSRSLPHLLTAAAALLTLACGSEPQPKPDLCGGKKDGKFTKLLGGIQSDVAFDLAQVGDKGFVLVGRSDSLKAGANRTWAAKVDEFGGFRWGTDLGPSSGVGEAHMLPLSDGGALVAHGSAKQGGAELIELDSDGKITWRTDLTNPAAAGGLLHLVTGLAVTGAEGKRADGGVGPGVGGVVSGVAIAGQGTAKSSRKALLVRFNPAGAPLWEKTYSKDALTQAEDVAVRKGGYLLVGWTEGKIGTTGRDFWAASVDTTGEPLWQKRWGGSLDDEARAVVVTDDGAVLTGLTRSEGAGDTDLWVGKIDNSGNPLWSRTYGGAGADEGAAITRYGDSLYLTGGHNSDKQPPGGLWLLHLDASGEVVWQHTYGEAWKTRGTAVVALQDGLAVAGASTLESMGSDDYWLLRTDEVGQQKCAGQPCKGADDLSCGPSLSCSTVVTPPVCQDLVK